MMKKWIAALLGLMLLLTCFTALAEDYTAAGVGTWTLPEGYEIDDTTYLSENDDDYKWLFMAFNDMAAIDTMMVQESDYAGQSLFSFTAQEQEELIAATVEDMSTDSVTFTYVETVTAGSVPFILYTVTGGDEGDYYYAETLADGWFISLSFYWADASDLSLPESELDAFRQVLASFVPDV